MIIIVQGIYMSLFKKYLAEARAPTTPKAPKSKQPPIWIAGTKKGEKFVFDHLRMTPQQRDNVIQTSNNPDHVLAARIANGIHERIINEVGNNPAVFGVSHVGGPKVASRRRKKFLNLKFYTTGRPVEDVALSTIADGKMIHHLIDLKLADSPSAGSFGQRKFNMMTTGVSRSTKRLRYKDRLPKQERFPYNAPRKTEMSNQPKTPDIAKHIANYLGQGIESEENNRQKIITPRLKDDSTANEYISRRIRNRRHNITTQLMNVHEPIPDNVRRHQVSVTRKWITIHNPDDAWNFFMKNFKPTHFTFEHNGGQTVRVVAHSKETEEGKSKPFHLGSIGVKHSNANDPNIVYNMKHKILDKLIKHYGYTNYTRIPTR